MLVDLIKAFALGMGIDALNSDLKLKDGDILRAIDSDNYFSGVKIISSSPLGSCTKQAVIDERVCYRAVAGMANTSVTPKSVVIIFTASRRLEPCPLFSRN